MYTLRYTLLYVLTMYTLRYTLLYVLHTLRTAPEVP